MSLMSSAPISLGYRQPTIIAHRAVALFNMSRRVLVSFGAHFSCQIVTRNIFRSKKKTAVRTVSPFRLDWSTGKSWTERTRSCLPADDNTDSMGMETVGTVDAFQNTGLPFTHVMRLYNLLIGRIVSCPTMATIALYLISLL